MDKWRPEAAGVSTVDPDCGAGVQGSGQQDGAQPSWWRDESTGAGAGPPGVSAEGPDDAMNEIVDWTTVLEKVLSAGSVANHNLPDIHLELESTSGYVYCPLRVRVDQDRLHHQVRACGQCAGVWTIGSGGGPSWHMAPYKTGFTWPGRELVPVGYYPWLPLPTTL